MAISTVLPDEVGDLPILQVMLHLSAALLLLYPFEIIPFQFAVLKHEDFSPWENHLRTKENDLRQVGTAGLRFILISLWELGRVGCTKISILLQILTLFVGKCFKRLVWDSFQSSWSCNFGKAMFGNASPDAGHKILTSLINQRKLLSSSSCPGNLK